jgi:hypothetical protein
MSATKSQPSIDTDAEAGSQSGIRIETAQYFINKLQASTLSRPLFTPMAKSLIGFPLSPREVASPLPLPASPFHPSPNAQDNTGSDS